MGIIFKHKKYCLFSHSRIPEYLKTPTNVWNRTCVIKISVCTTGERDFIDSCVFSTSRRRVRSGSRRRVSHSSIKSVFSPLVHNIRLYYTRSLSKIFPSPRKVCRCNGKSVERYVINSVSQCFLRRAVKEKKNDDSGIATLWHFGILIYLHRNFLITFPDRSHYY